MIITFIFFPVLVQNDFPMESGNLLSTTHHPFFLLIFYEKGTLVSSSFCTADFNLWW